MSLQDTKTSQTFSVRGVREGNSFDALREALAARALVNNWQFPSGLPANSLELRQRVCDELARIDPDRGDKTFMRSCPDIDDWDNMFTAQFCIRCAGKLWSPPIDWQDYVRLLRQPNMSVQDKRVLAVAAAVFRVRILVVSRNLERPGEMVIKQDLWPEVEGLAVPEDRIVMLVENCPEDLVSNYYWAHPVPLPHHPFDLTQMGFSPCLATIELHTYFVPFWPSEQGLSPLPLGQPAPSDADIECLLKEHPGATALQAKTSLVMSRTAKRSRTAKSGENLPKAGRLLAGLLAASDPAHPIVVNSDASAAWIHEPIEGRLWRNAQPANQVNRRLLSAAQREESDGDDSEDHIILAQGGSMAGLAHQAASKERHQSQSGRDSDESDN